VSIRIAVLSNGIKRITGRYLVRNSLSENKDNRNIIGSILKNIINK
jgi:hypothetical protein